MHYMLIDIVKSCPSIINTPPWTMTNLIKIKCSKNVLQLSRGWSKPELRKYLHLFPLKTNPILWRFIFLDIKRAPCCLLSMRPSGSACAPLSAVHFCLSLKPYSPNKLLILSHFLCLFLNSFLQQDQGPDSGNITTSKLENRMKT